MKLGETLCMSTGSKRGSHSRGFLHFYKLGVARNRRGANSSWSSEEVVTCFVQARDGVESSTAITVATTVRLCRREHSGQREREHERRNEREDQPLRSELKASGARAYHGVLRTYKRAPRGNNTSPIIMQSCVGWIRGVEGELTRGLCAGPSCSAPASRHKSCGLLSSTE